MVKYHTKELSKKVRRIVCKLSRLKSARAKRLKSVGKRKYFCIGRNKTGTTSLKKAFEDLGYPVGDQAVAEKLTDISYFKGDFSPIIQYCESAQVFQDVPFSWPETYKYLDRAYPGSKFILTVRDADQWYRSITRFHAKMFGGGKVPTAEDLKHATYVRKAWMYDAVKLHGAPDEDIYNEEILKSHYQNYNEGVIEYFKDRPNDLCVINISEKESYKTFCDFLGVAPIYDTFPWENKT